MWGLRVKAPSFLGPILLRMRSMENDLARGVIASRATGRPYPCLVMLLLHLAPSIPHPHYDRHYVPRPIPRIAEARWVLIPYKMIRLQTTIILRHLKIFNPFK